MAQNFAAENMQAFEGGVYEGRWLVACARLAFPSALLQWLSQCLILSTEKLTSFPSFLC